MHSACGRYLLWGGARSRMQPSTDKDEQMSLVSCCNNAEDQRLLIIGADIDGRRHGGHGIPPLSPDDALKSSRRCPLHVQCRCSGQGARVRHRPGRGRVLDGRPVNGYNGQTATCRDAYEHAAGSDASAADAAGKITSVGLPGTITPTVQQPYVPRYSPPSLPPS